MGSDLLAHFSKHAKKNRAVSGFRVFQDVGVGGKIQTNIFPPRARNFPPEVILIQNIFPLGPDFEHFQSPKMLLGNVWHGPLKITLFLLSELVQIVT